MPTFVKLSVVSLESSIVDPKLFSDPDPIFRRVLDPDPDLDPDPT
jgi:hypothetical protein